MKLSNLFAAQTLAFEREGLQQQLAALDNVRISVHLERDSRGPNTSFAPFHDAWKLSYSDRAMADAVRLRVGHELAGRLAVLDARLFALGLEVDHLEGGVGDPRGASKV